MLSTKHINIQILIYALLAIIRVYAVTYVGLTQGQLDKEYDTFAPPKVRNWYECSASTAAGINVPMVANLATSTGLKWAYILNQLTLFPVSNGQVRWEYRIFNDNDGSRGLRLIRSGTTQLPIEVTAQGVQGLGLAYGPPHLTVVFNQNEISPAWPPMDTYVHFPLTQRNYICRCGFLGLGYCNRSNYALDINNMYVTQYNSSSGLYTLQLAGTIGLQAWNCPSSTSTGSCERS